MWNGKDANGNDLESGVYFYKLTAPNSTVFKKMVILK
ncbi:MAG: T9SS type A sorting domain-containing protein [Bacteroidales bacterium]|nr:T9SS type A sorting domain-containing protein [Bacteroidales bacterium]